MSPERWRQGLTTNEGMALADGETPDVDSMYADECDLVDVMDLIRTKRFDEAEAILNTRPRTNMLMSLRERLRKTLANAREREGRQLAKVRQGEVALESGEITPANLGELSDFAAKIANTELVPKHYRGRPEAVIACFAAGAEMGLKPMASLRSFGIINGRAVLYGDGIRAVVLIHPSVTSIVEEEIGKPLFGKDGAANPDYGWRVTITRNINGVEMTFAREFTVDDAILANLWKRSRKDAAGGDSVWAKYPKRMLYWRAMGYAVRDALADAMVAGNVQFEGEDAPIDMGKAEVVDARPPSATSRLAQVVGAEKAGEAQDTPEGVAESSTPDRAAGNSDASGDPGGQGIEHGQEEGLEPPKPPAGGDAKDGNAQGDDDEGSATAAVIKMIAAGDFDGAAGVLNRAVDMAPELKKRLRTKLADSRKKAKAAGAEKPDGGQADLV